MESNYIIKLPECPTCYNEFSPKRVCYIVCFNGHSICEVCNKKRRNRLECPICRQSAMPTGGVVNRSTMDMIAEIRKANPTLNKEATKPLPSTDIIIKWKLYSEEENVEEMKKILDAYNCEDIIDNKDDDGISILSKAIILGHEEVVALLLDYGANMAIKTQDGRSIILLAGENMDIDMIKLLFNKDEDEVLIGDFIQDAFNYACEYGYLDIVKLLITKSIDINHKDTNCHDMTPLMRASKNGHYQIVNFLIEEDVELDEVDSMQRTALYHACESRHYYLVHELIHAGASTRTYKDMNYLIAACKSGHLEVVQALLANGVRADETNSNKQAALMTACEYGYIEIVEELLGSNINLRRKNDKGNTALIYACMGGWIDIVCLLLNHRAIVGVDIDMINYRNNESQTALMIAAEYGYIDIVTYLIEKHASLDLIDLKTLTPLMIACRAGHAKIVEILIDKGADVTKQDINDMDVMLQACDSGNLAMVEVLLKKGMNVNFSKDPSLTPLMAASQNDHTHIVEFLLSHGANVDVTGLRGMTAFMLACEEGQLGVLPSLYNKNPSVINIADIDGYTPLISACAEGHTTIITWLLDHHADMKMRDNDGRSAYHAACLRDQLESIKVLVERHNGIQHIEDYVLGLFIAVELGHVETVRYLLTIGIPVNSTDNEGMTALMCACRGAHYDIVKVLVENGADIHMTTASGCNALLSVSDVTITTSKYSTASSYKTGPRYEIIKYLLDQGADLESKDDKGLTLCLRLCAWGHVNMMKQLISTGANAYAVDNDGNNLLMLACDREDTCMSILIIQYVLSLPDICINHQNYTGDTALMIACRSQYHSYEKNAILLEKEEIKLNTQNERGETALMMACARGDSRAVQLLLSHSTIDVNIQDYEGNTALMKAVQSGHLNIVQLLVEHGAKVDIVHNKGMTVIQMLDISTSRKPSKTMTIKRYFERISVAAAATSTSGDNSQNDNANATYTNTSASTNSNADQSNVSNIEMVDHTSSHSLTTIPITRSYSDATTSHNSISVNEPFNAGSNSDNHHDNGNNVCMRSSSSGYIHSDSIDSNVTTDRSDSDANSSVEENVCSDNDSKENYNYKNDLNDNSDVHVYVADIQCHTQEENKRKNENDRDISEDSTMEQSHIKRNRST